jgi:hypothetical protein
LLVVVLLVVAVFIIAVLVVLVIVVLIVVLVAAVIAATGVVKEATTIVVAHPIAEIGVIRHNPTSYYFGIRRLKIR